MHYYTPPQVAKARGVTTKTVYDWIRSGKLVAYRIGGRYHILQADFDATRTDTVTREQLVGAIAFRSRVDRGAVDKWLDEQPSGNNREFPGAAVGSLTLNFQDWYDQLKAS